MIRQCGLRGALVVAITVTASLPVAAQQDKPAVGPAVLTSSAGMPHTRQFQAAPGPDAEYLSLVDRYTMLAAGGFVHERTSRLRLNTYLAINRKYGETRIEYDPMVDTVVVLENRAILPSGARVEAPANALVEDQPPVAHGNPLWAGLRRKVIVHTALEPGVVVEETIRVTRAATALPWLELGEPLAAEVPVQERVVTVDVPEITTLRWHVTGGTVPEASQARTGDRVVWTWVLRNVAARPEEPGAPTRPEGWAMLWASTCASHQALEADLAMRLHSGEPAPTDLVDLVRTTAAQAGADEVRVLRVLEAVKDRLHISAIPETLLLGRAKAMAEVWRAGWATPLELARLQQAALDAVGLPATVTLIAAPDLDLTAVPALAGTVRTVLAVSWPDQRVRFYDPLRPGQGPPQELVLAGRDGLTTMPLVRPEVPPPDPAQTLRLRLEVSPDGSLRGNLAFDASGAATPHARMLQEPDKLAGELAGCLPGLKASQVRVVGLTREGATLTASIEGSLPSGRLVGLVRLDLGSVPGGAEVHLPPLPASDRQAPVALPGPVTETVELTLILPEGWTVAASPTATRVATQVGTVEINSSQDRGTINLTRRLVLSTARGEARDHAAIHELLVAWRNPGGREILLRPSTKAAEETR